MFSAVCVSMALVKDAGAFVVMQSVAYIIKLPLYVDKRGGKSQFVDWLT
jgi:hypothetical protein